jgi:hypothetical protein
MKTDLQAPILAMPRHNEECGRPLKTAETRNGLVMPCIATKVDKTLPDCDRPCTRVPSSPNTVLLDVEENEECNESTESDKGVEGNESRDDCPSGSGVYFNGVQVMAAAHPLQHCSTAGDLKSNKTNGSFPQGRPLRCPAPLRKLSYNLPKLIPAAHHRIKTKNQVKRMPAKPVNLMIQAAEVNRFRKVPLDSEQILFLEASAALKSQGLVTQANLAMPPPPPVFHCYC